MFGTSVKPLQMNAGCGRKTSEEYGYVMKAADLAQMTHFRHSAWFEIPTTARQGLLYSTGESAETQSTATARNTALFIGMRWDAESLMGPGWRLSAREQLRKTLRDAGNVMIRSSTSNPKGRPGIALRVSTRNTWVPRRGDLGPKTIDQIHKEAELEEHREQIKVQQQLLSKKYTGGRGSGGGGGRISVPQDEGWNTVVPISTKNRPIDTSRLSKITKPAALDFDNQLLAPGGKGTWGSWGKGGSSGGLGSKPSGEAAPESGRGGGRISVPQDEGWNTVVPISTKNRPIDTSRLSKITKPAALDFDNQLLAPGGKGTWGSWGKGGSSGGSGSKPSGEAAPESGRPATSTLNRFSALQQSAPSASAPSTADSDRRVPQRNSSSRERSDRFERPERLDRGSD
ncbi:hypothetical protein SKAU_G00078690 [Synaphobranchus kaupii]|uniref:Uncharacterized protein n=1 Tax=Synaphobranchus kaupii TaxID=118154 RepID=A0A9Q1FUF8_SYNKA|nr:hypothetical protein SKAU_G00078690 [Synaphobranchus kaupii]